MRYGYFLTVNQIVSRITKVSVDVLITGRMIPPGLTQCLVWPDQGLNPRTTAHYISTLTITNQPQSQSCLYLEYSINWWYKYKKLPYMLSFSLKVNSFSLNAFLKSKWIYFSSELTSLELESVFIDKTLFCWVWFYTITCTYLS